MSSNVKIPSVTSGQSVRVVANPSGASDQKLPFYDFFNDLTGSVGKVYDDGSATVVVDLKSLPEEVRQRHAANEQPMRDKWLGGLSEEEKNRLTASQKKFSLRYTILVSARNLLPLESARSDAKAGQAHSSAPQKPAAASAQAATAVPVPTRRSLTDLEAEEERHLREIQNQAEKG